MCLTEVIIDLEFPSYSVNEENGPIEVCAVITSGSLERSVVVTLAPAEGTATGEKSMIINVAAMNDDVPDPEDFKREEMMLTFDQNVSRVCIDIPIEDDDISEDPEDFPVILTSDDPDVSSTRPMTNVTIVDDDVVTIGFENEVYPSREDQGTVQVCARIFNSTLDREVTITLMTRDDTATEPDDYTSISTSISFDRETEEQCVDIPLENDDILESLENFEVILDPEDEERIILSPEIAVVMVVDDDCKY